MANFFDNARDWFKRNFGSGDDNEIVDFSGPPDEANFDEEREPDNSYHWDELTERLLDNPDDLTPEQYGAELAGKKYELGTIQDAMNYCQGTPMNVLKIYITPDGKVEVWRFPSD